MAGSIELPEGFIIEGEQDASSTLPEGFIISDPEEPITKESVEMRSPVSGGKFSGFGDNERGFADTLPEIGEAPELNELSVPAFKASYALLATGDNNRIKESLLEQYGDAIKFEEDEKGNTVINLPSGQYALNKTGISPQDIARGLFGASAMTPAGRAKTFAGSVLGAGATSAAIEAGAAQTGAGFDPQQVAIDAALGGVGKVAEDIVTGGIRAARGKLSGADEALEAASKETGIPLMTTDVVKPDTLSGRLAQSTGEVIPFAGTGGKRASQQAAREEFVESFASQYTPRYEEVVQGLKNQTNRVKQAAGARLGKIQKDMAEFGEINPNNSIMAIDNEIAALTAKGRVPDDATVAQLQRYRDALEEGQTFETLDTLRSDFREQVKGDRQVMPNRSQAAIDRIYKSMTNDMDSAIKNNLGDDALARFKSAKSIYASEANKIKNTKIKNILQKGDITPEQAGQMIFSKKPSEIKNLYQSLDQKGREAARSTVISKAIEDASKRVNGLTPNTLASELGKYQTQYNVMFKGAEKKQIEGLIELLNATRRAQDAKVVTPTGQMLLGPLGGYAAFTDLASTLGGGLTIGGFARAYESGPVKRALLQLKNSPKGSKAYDSALQNASEVMRTLLIAQPEAE